VARWKKKETADKSESGLMFCTVFARRHMATCMDGVA
jgi:hypothetical protein